MLRPAAKAPVAAVQARRAVGRQHRRLNQQGTGAAHRIEQRGARHPAGAHHDRRREVFFDRRHTGAIAVAAQVQAFAAQIQRDVRRLFVQPDVDPQIGRLTIDVRARQILTGEAVDNSVFDLQRAVLAVADLLIETAKMHREGGARVKHLRPRNGLYAEVQIQIAVYATLAQRQHDARSQPAPHQALIQQARIPLKMDPALDYLAVRRAKPFQFSF